jgi:tRNA threonylcarbamoyl adenosine modification protein (Sua5/YciO/YrdC/YwlC family)
MDRLRPDAAGLARAAELLRRGGVVAFPTDTVYGLAALARDRRACQRIYEIKGRSRSQPLIAMVADADRLQALVRLDERARAFMRRWWPGPLTLVLPTVDGEPATLGVRIPDHPVALSLLREVGEALATTSANRSGQPPAMTAEEAALPGLAAVLDGGRVPGGVASTVLSLTGPDAEVLREGPVAKEEAYLFELAFKFRTFAEREVVATSPLYAAICRAVADRPDVLALLLGAVQGQRRPNLLLAAVHYLLLGGDGELASYYPSLGGARPPDAACGELFAEFVLAHRAELEALIRTHRTQTNEVGRCTGLLLALGLLAEPLAVIDVGASAGLNLNLDRYGYDYGEHGCLAGEREAPVLRCQVRRGRPPVPGRVPWICWRVGIDLAPLDPADETTGRWLDALIWPEHTERRQVLRQALAVARRHPVEVRCGDALELLPAVAAEAPRDATLVVAHANTLAYFSLTQRLRLVELCREAKAAVVSLEGEPGQPWHRNLLQLDGRTLAICDPHGRWIEWTG